MDWVDVVLKFGGFLVAATAGWYGLRKVREELLQMRWTSRRSDFDFAMKVAEAFNDHDVKRFAEVAAYAGLTKDRHLTHAQRKILLSFADSARTIERYMLVRDHLQIDVASRSLCWTKRLSARWVRSVLRAWLGIAYLGSCFLAVGPWLLWMTKGTNDQTIVQVAPQIFATLTFVPMAVYCVWRARVLSDAHMLVSELAQHAKATESKIECQPRQRRRRRRAKPGTARASRHQAASTTAQGTFR